MKITNLMLAFLCLALLGKAQNAPQALPFNQQRTDAILGNAQRNNIPLVVPAPKMQLNNPGFKDVQSTFATQRPTGDFNKLYPGAIVLNRTAQGTIYAMPQDKMRVLVPDMQQVEPMPGSEIFKVAPPANMPNPLHPGNKK
jgi:hypothetical protein